MSRTVRSALAVIPFLLAVACGDSARAPAEAAIAAAGKAIESLKGDVVTYAPDAVKGAERALADARALAEKQDYQGALKAAAAIPDKVKAAFVTAASRKQRVEAAFAELSSTAGQTVADLRKRVDTLSASRKLPRGVDRAAVDAAREGLAEIESSWKQLPAMADRGELESAISEGMRLKVKAQDLLKSLAGQ
ncbi:MAG TPA: hypothetical protein VFM45_01410 [Anaeromyxobacteraceae bacterium]|nr:hypothetical protein [Anaeromyxobacteraceae bacterium]